MELGKKIVALYHSSKEAEAAQKEFEKVFSKKELPTEMPEYLMLADEISVLDLVMSAKLAKSKSDARRMIEQNGVKINGQTTNDMLALIKITKEGIVLQYGKKTFVRVKTK